MKRWLTIWVLGVLALALSGGLNTAHAQSAPPTPTYDVQIDTAKYAYGDDPAWAEPTFDDSAWDSGLIYAIETEEQVFWIRKSVQVNPKYRAGDAPLGIIFSALAASEIYWNGVLVAQNGTPAATPEGETPGRLYAIAYIPQSLIRADENIVAIRGSTQHLQRPVLTSVYALILTDYTNPLAYSRDLYEPVIPLFGLFIAGMLYFGLASAMQRRRAAGWLAAASLFAAIQLGAEVSRGFINYTYDWHLIRLALSSSVGLGSACPF